MLLVYIVPLVLATILGLILALIIAGNRQTPGTRTLMGLILAACLWCAGYAMEFLVSGLEIKLFWAKFQYFGIIIIPVAWFIFAIQHTGPPPWLVRFFKYRALLWVIPLITLILVWTNDYHGLVWSSVRLLDVDSAQLLELHYGPWFWIYWVYAYLLLLLGTIRFIEGLTTTMRLYRWQIRLAILASLIPWAGNLIYVSGLSPIEHLDLTPFTFILSSLLLIISLFGFQLIRLLPIAQKTVFEGLADCLVVLDLHDRIVDLNPSARKMISASDLQLGKPLEEVYPQLAQWIKPASRDESYNTEVMCGEEPDVQYFEVIVSPLYGPYLNPVGRLVVCHDITQHKQQQTTLEEARSELETIVSERTEMLKSTVEQLQHELTQRALAERRFEDVFEAAPDAMMLIDQSISIRLINAQAEKLFGYEREELLGQDVTILIPGETRSKRKKQLLDYISNLDTWQIRSDRNLSIIRKDGSQFPMEISMSPLDTVEGRWLAFNIRDISTRKQAEEEQLQLLEEIQESREQLRILTFRLQEVQEYERRQISTELHDRVGQNLTGLNLNLQIIEDQLKQNPNPVLQARLEDSLLLVEETTRQVRDVMSDLRPPMLDEFGLLSALKWYGNRFSNRTGIAIDVIGNEFKPRLSPDDELVLFRIVQEALNNVARHAHANEAYITLVSSADTMLISVKDNGVGFDPSATDKPTRQPHWGLINIEQRAASIGGKLQIESAPGKGTLLTVTIKRPKDEN